ncbi:12077_t:CDS:2, partial [Dentiscutata erythropus]
KVFHNLSITPNDPLLSGILDIENIIVRHTLIKKELERENLWKTVDEQIQHMPLNKRLIEFILDILEVQQNPSVNIQECENQSLFSNTKDLVNCGGSSINESTWEHDVLNPIVKYITYDLEEDIFIRWDNVTSKTSQRRNGSKGPIKKNDIFGVHRNDGIYEWEVLIGEVSNGPFNNTMQAQSHASDDHVKLGKCAKDTLDDALNFINLNYSTETRNFEIFKEINTFLIHAHGTSLELYILDQKFEPFFRLRRLSNISIPYKE